VVPGVRGARAPPGVPSLNGSSRTTQLWMASAAPISVRERHVHQPSGSSWFIQAGQKAVAALSSTQPPTVEPPEPLASARQQPRAGMAPAHAQAPCVKNAPHVHEIKCCYLDTASVPSRGSSRIAVLRWLRRTERVSDDRYTRWSHNRSEGSNQLHRHLQVSNRNKAHSQTEISCKTDASASLSALSACDIYPDVPVFSFISVCFTAKQTVYMALLPMQGS
jgi:hypothetical protein